MGQRIGIVPSIVFSNHTEAKVSVTSVITFSHERKMGVVWMHICGGSNDAAMYSNIAAAVMTNL